MVCDLRGDDDFISVLASLGLTLGTELSVVRNSAHAPLLITVHDTRLAVGRSEAAQIEIELLAA